MRDGLTLPQWLLSHSLWSRSWFWVLLWSCIQLFCCVYYGPKVLVDTQRYVEEAAAWRAGIFVGTYHFWYSGYILFLSCFPDPVEQVYGVMACQFLVAFVAFMALLQLVDYKNSAKVRLLLLVYIFYIPYHQWNICLLTESLFCSCILLFLYCWQFRVYTYAKYGLFFSLLLICTLRPNGFLMPVAFFLSVVWQARREFSRWFWLFSLSAGVLLLYLVNFYTDVFYLFIKNAMLTGDYICGYPSVYQIPLESVQQVDASYQGTLTKLVALFVKHPGTFLILIGLKVGYLLLEVRPFYHIYHNIWAAGTVAVLYFMVLRNIRHLIPDQNIALFFVLLNMALVALTYCDWDGRFFAALFPCLLYLACPKTLKS